MRSISEKGAERDENLLLRGFAGSSEQPSVIGYNLLFLIYDDLKELSMLGIDIFLFEVLGYHREVITHVKVMCYTKITYETGEECFKKTV